MDAGIAPCDFWEYSLQEISDIIASYNRKYEYELKEKYLLNYSLAQMIANNVACLFSSESEVLSLWDYNPELFKTEKDANDKKRIAAELELHKERMKIFAERFNSRRNLA